MAYCKRWVPPTIPLRDNLAAWQTLFQDLCDNLEEAGLVETDDSEGLDFSSVMVLPADGTFEGSRTYRFDDALQAEAPVEIKLSFGCVQEGLAVNNSARTKTPWVRSQVFFKGDLVSTTYNPQISSTIIGNVTSQLTKKGMSSLQYHEESGFFGYVYGAGSRNNPIVNTNNGYIGATLSLFIQRSLSLGGTPTDSHIGVYAPALGPTSLVNLWQDGVLPRAVASCSLGDRVARDTMAPRVGRKELSSGIDGILLEPIYMPSSPPRPFPFIYSYWHEDIAEGEIFEFQPMIGPPRNFIALGRETCMSIDAIDGQRAGIAMLFEGD